MTWFVVDGMDGSGKTTVSGALKKELESRGRKVMLVEHPNRKTALGRVEARLLQSDGVPAMLFAIALYMVDVIRSVLRMKMDDDHDDFIFVRYTMAVSYLPDGLSKKAYKIFAGILPIPDVSILVDVDADLAYSRICGRGDDLERFENPESLADTRRKMLMLSNGWVVLDNTGGFDESCDEIRRLLDGL